MQKERNYGLDLYRILCCIGVLVYHVMDDIIGGGQSATAAKALYFGASYCVPGFFLLSGYLLGLREELSIEYIENKIIAVMKKLFAWTIFWGVIHFFLLGETIDLWGSMVSGIRSEGILPVAWFLFTYCLLLIIGYPLWHFSRKHKLLYCMLAVVWIILLACGFGRGLIAAKPQSLWLHLYGGYFAMGLALPWILEWINGKINNRVIILAIAFMFAIGISAYAFRLKTAKVLLSPHNYYGTWQYSMYLIGFFLLCTLFSIKKGAMCLTVKTLSRNTFAVYLGHLPLLLYITAIRPVGTTIAGCIYIAGIFVLLEIMAEVFKKMPLLRKLI